MGTNIGKVTLNSKYKNIKIHADIIFIQWRVRYTTVTFKPLSDEVCSNYDVFKLKNCLFSTVD